MILIIAVQTVRRFLTVGLHHEFHAHITEENCPAPWQFLTSSEISMKRMCTWNQKISNALAIITSAKTFVASDGEPVITVQIKIRRATERKMKSVRNLKLDYC